jgi:hypothetical protein
MIYCGSGSYFGKVLGPVPDSISVPVPAPALVPVPAPDLLSEVFQQQKISRNLAISMLEAALFISVF